MSHGGLAAKLKDLTAIRNIAFLATLKGMQSFLGSLNYYSRFVENYAVYAAILYEWRPGMDEPEPGPDGPDARLDADPPGRTYNVRAQHAFRTLKERLLAAPLLKHFDADKEAVVVLYTTPWAVAGSLVQDHDGVYHPVKFTSRVLKPAERNYHESEREILALLRVLYDSSFSQLAGRQVKVFTRTSALGWLWKANGLQGRLAQWAALLSPWSLEIVKSDRGEDELIGLLATSLTPRAQMDEALDLIRPAKSSAKNRVGVQDIPTLPRDTDVFVLSFDGSAKSKRTYGSCSALVWKLPEWEIVSSRGLYLPEVTVNEAEYAGCELSLELAAELGIKKVVVCGDSKLAIRQLQGEMA